VRPTAPLHLADPLKRDPRAPLGTVGFAEDPERDPLLPR